MQKINRLLIFINLFFLQSYLIRFQIGNYPTNLQEILIFLNAITFFILIIQEKRLLKTLKNLKNHRIIISFALLTTISILTVPIISQTDFLRHLKFLFFALIFSFIFLQSLNKEQRKTALTIGAFGALSFGLFSLIYNFSGLNVAADHRLTGPLDAAVYLAFYLTPFFIFTSLEYLKNPKNFRKIWLPLLLGILILLTRSMGAIGGSFIILAFYVLKNSTLLNKKFFKTALIIATISIVALIFYTKILPTINTEYSSLDERGEIWKTSAYLIKDHLFFGLGFGQFQEHYFQNVTTVLEREPLDYYVLQPHNIFLLFIFQYGILGLLLISMIIFKVGKNIFEQKNLTGSLIAAYFILHGLIDTPFFKNDLLTLLIIFFELSTDNQSTSKTP